VSSTLASAAGERAAGRQPSRLRSLAAAAVAGLAAGVFVYRLLRQPQ
jgi:hypothetical protein